MAATNPLAEARKLTNLNLDGLADEAVMGKNTLWRLENGVGKPQKGRVKLAVAALHRLADDPETAITATNRAALKAITVEVMFADLTRWQEQHEGEGSGDD